MPNLIVKVVNEQGQPLSGVTVTLTGADTREFRITEAGQGTFPDLAPGDYMLQTALHRFISQSTPLQMGTEDKSIQITLKAADEASPADRKNFLNRALGMLQIPFLIVVAFVFILFIYKGIASVDFSLNNDETARGLITFLVAVVTVGIALILVLAAILSSGDDLEKRMGFGKEVFAVLIGVLGTIMGFYYGQAAKPGAEAPRQVVLATSTPVTINPNPPELNKPFTISTAVTGGKPPYTYSVKFTPPDAVEPTDAKPFDNQPSPDGKISREFKFKQGFSPTPDGTPLNFIVEVKDAGGGTLTFDNDKDGNKIVMKPIKP